MIEKASFKELWAVLMPAMAEARLGPGRLMSPAQLAQAVSGRAGKERHLHGWWLCASGDERMFSAPAEMALGVTVLDAGGPAYLVVAVQWQHWQVRIVVPVVGVAAQAYVTTLARERELQVALARGESDDALILRLALDAGVAERLAALPPLPDVDVAAFLEDYVQLLGRLVQPPALRPLPGMPAVREVGVAYLLPDGMSFYDALAPRALAAAQSVH